MLAIMITINRSRRWYVFIILVWVAFVASCTHHPGLKAYAGNNPDWKMIEHCFGEGCHARGDFLIGHGGNIYIQFDEPSNKQFSTLSIHFGMLRKTLGDFEIPLDFNPSKVLVRLPNGEMLMPKAFPCRRTIYELDYFRSNPGIEESSSVKEGDCFLLFFDRYVNPKEITLDITEALVSTAKPINVPLIHFF